MLGHISLGVRDLAKAATFYDAAMSALGYVRTDSSETTIGYGPPGGDDGLRLIERSGAAPPGPGFHLAFAAPSQAAVDRFHAAALRHGGTDNGGPGLRPGYGPNYYAAFALDPDGHCLEAKHPPPEG
jgi:catechol 2,3-dioxygenase-like lactoylglutathione lyase family enzyme